MSFVYRNSRTGEISPEKSEPVRWLLAGDRFEVLSRRQDGSFAGSMGTF